MSGKMTRGEYIARNITVQHAEWLARKRAAYRAEQAALEMLAALKEARDSIELSNYAGEEDDILALIDAAIASATGDA